MSDNQYHNMINVIKEAYPDYDISRIGDVEMMYYDALKKLTSKKDEEARVLREKKFNQADFIHTDDRKALRYNEGKPQWSLVHFQSLEPLVRVLEYGTRKYSKDNWKKGLDKSAILESMMRHLTALLDGEEKDPESGELHIGHIMCNAMFWQYFHQKESDKELSTLVRTMR